MKLPITLAVGLLLLIGCKAPSFSVTEKKTTPKPYRKVFIMCVDGEYNFSFPDSNLYNIAVVNYFRDTALLGERNREASLLSESMSSSQTEVIKLSQAFWLETYSYRNLRTLIDSSGIDAIFVYDLLKHFRVEVVPGRLPGTSLPNTPGMPVSYGGSSTVLKADKGAFKCYLIDVKSNGVVWSGFSELKSNAYTGTCAITRAAAHAIAKELAAGMYIIADR